MLDSYKWLVDHGGNIESVYTKDEILTNIMYLLGHQLRNVGEPHLLRDAHRDRW